MRFVEMQIIIALFIPFAAKSNTSVRGKWQKKTIFNIFSIVLHSQRFTFVSVCARNKSK